jgi:hypothetical protein
LAFDVPGDAPATLDWRAAEQAADRLHARYGYSVVQPARLVDPGQGD